MRANIGPAAQSACRLHDDLRPGGKFREGLLVI